MTYRYCPACGVVGPDDTETCPLCQAPTLPYRPEER